MEEGEAQGGVSAGPCPLTPGRERSPGLPWSQEAARRAGWSSPQAQLSSLRSGSRDAVGIVFLQTASSALHVIIM